MKKFFLLIILLLICYSFALAKSLTIDEIISLKQLGFNETEILNEIKKTGIIITPQEEKKLKNAGFSPQFIVKIKNYSNSKKTGSLSVEEFIKLLEQNKPVKEILETIKNKGEKLVGNKELIKKRYQGSIPYPVLLALEGNPLSLEQLSKLAEFGLGKEEYKILISIVGVKKQQIPPSKALELIKAGVPPEVIKMFKKEEKVDLKNKGGSSPLQVNKANKFNQSIVLENGEYKHIGKKFIIKAPKGWRLIRGIDEGDVYYALTPEKKGYSIDDLKTFFALYVLPAESLKDIYWVNDLTAILKKIVLPSLVQEYNLNLQGDIQKIKISDLEVAKASFHGNLNNKKGIYKGNVYVLYNANTIYFMITMSPDELFNNYNKDFEYILANSTFGLKKPSTRGKKFDASELVKKYKKSVVVVNAVTGLRGSQGSGFIIHKDGYILTNWHVIWDPQANKPFEEISVSWDDSLKMPSQKAKLIGFVHRTSRQVKLGGADVALLKIAPGDYTPIPLTPVKDVELGDEVITLGFPRSDIVSGYSIFITKGVVVRYNRDLQGNVESLAIDAKITHGNSGGPCISLKTGGAIGLNTWGFNIGEIGEEGESLNDLVGYYFVCTSDTAAKQFPLVLSLGIGNEDKLGFLDFYELSSLYLSSNAPYAALRLAEKALAKDENKYSLTQKATALVSLVVADYIEEPTEAQKKVNEAISLYKKALNKDPKYQEALNYLVEVLFEIGKTKEAKTYAEKCVEYYPDDWETHLQLAKIHFSLKESEKGKKELNKALELSKELVPDPYILAGTLAYSENKLEEGKKLYTQASRIQPKNLEARIGEIEYLELKKQWQQAIDAYKKLLAEFPQNPIIYFRIGVCFRNLNKIDNCLRYYGDALSNFKKRGFFPPGDLLIDIADIFEKEKKNTNVAIKFLSKYLLYYGNEKDAIKIHARLASIINNQGAASAHVRTAYKLAQELNTKFEAQNFQFVDLSLNDIKYMLNKGYPPLVVANLILNTRLNFNINSQKDIEELIKVHKLPFSVVRAIIETVKKEGPAVNPQDNMPKTETGPPLPPQPQPPQPLPPTGPQMPNAPAPVPQPPEGYPQLPAPPNADNSWFVGVWTGSYSIPGIGTMYERDVINPDGTFFSQMWSAYGSRTAQGMWRIDGNILILSTQAGEVRRNFRRIGANVLSIFIDEIGMWVNFTKEYNAPY